MLSVEYIILLVMICLSLRFYKNKTLIVCILCYMTILAVLRAKTVGTDTAGYAEDFYKLKSLERGANYIRHIWEYGYIASIILFKKFSNDYLLFISLTFIPIIIGTIKFIKDSQVNFAYAIFVFFTFGFYFDSFNLMRQMMVIAIIVSALPLLHKQKYIVFAIVTIIFSFLFHQSEIMFLLLIPIHYFVCHGILKLNKKWLYFLLIFSFVVFYIGNSVLVNLFSSFAFAHYLEYITVNNNTETGNMYSFVYTLFAIIVIYVKNDKNYIFESYVFSLSVVMFNIFNTFSMFGSRVAIDFMFFMVILLPQMLFDCQTKHRKLFLYITLIFCFGTFVFKYVISNMSEINPYRFR